MGDLAHLWGLVQDEIDKVMFTPEIRFVAVIVVIVCVFLGAATGLESKLNISSFIAELMSRLLSI